MVNNMNITKEQLSNFSTGLGRSNKVSPNLLNLLNELPEADYEKAMVTLTDLYVSKMFNEKILATYRLILAAAIDNEKIKFSDDAMRIFKQHRWEDLRENKKIYKNNSLLM